MLQQMSLGEMVSLVRSGSLSSLELVEAHLSWIDKRNPEINAFTMLFAQQARDAARRADQGLKAGPLHGIPLTVKDSFDVAGHPTRLGSFFTPEVPAAEDSAVVARLRKAGAIILGKTNTPEFLASYETDNYVTGRTNHPHDSERTPGGSSGGEAAAIAAGMSPGGVGSDAGGSIRVPAHFCGIAGFKPTPGRISLVGHRSDEIPGGLIAAGPMARTVSDVKLLFEALAGFDDRDAQSAPVPLRETKLDGIRIGVMEQFYEVPVQPAIRKAVQDAAAALAGLGFRVEEFRPEGIERAPNLWAFFYSELRARAMKERIAGREPEAHWTYTEGLDRALDRPPASGWQVVEMLAGRDAMRRKLVEQMRRVPVLLLPVAGIAAFRHRDRSESLFKGMMPSTTFNLLGFPALAVPFAGDVGVQVVGRPWDDELVLEVGEILFTQRR